MIRIGSRVSFYANNSLSQGIVVNIHRYKNSHNAYRSLKNNALSSMALFIKLTNGKYTFKNNDQVELLNR